MSSSFRVIVFINFFFGLSIITSHANFREGFTEAQRMVSPISKTESQKRIYQFRNQRLNGDYSLRFQLTNEGKNQLKKNYFGIVWGTWGPEGPILRIELWPDDPNNREYINLLVYNGANPKIWKSWGSTGKVEELSYDSLFKPIWGNMVYTPFDLMFNFMYWDDFVYEGSGRTRSRPAHNYFFKAPDSLTQLNPDYYGVYVSLDANYNTIIAADLIDVRGTKHKTIRILSLKKIQKQFVIGSILLENKCTRQKSRFEVITGAMGLAFEPQYFFPENLSKQPPFVPEERFAPSRKKFLGIF